MVNIRQFFKPLDYIKILRPNQWFKNLVVTIGVIAALFYFKIDITVSILLEKIFPSFILSCLVSSANYIINDIVDEKSDFYHPIKKNRIINNQKISRHSLYLIVGFLFVVSFLAGEIIYGRGVFIALFSLFLAGIFYNIKPLRFKDLPFLDVIAESVNNPIRILIGWFTVSKLLVYPPLTFLLFFWTSGAALMSLKRYIELKFLLRNGEQPPFLYRNSYRTYTLSKISFMVLLYMFISVIFLTLFALNLYNL